MDREKLREAQRELSNLANSPGWAKLREGALSQIEGRIESLILSSLKGMDEVLEQEYRKGEIAGLKLFLELPAILLGNLEAELKVAPNDRSE